MKRILLTAALSLSLGAGAALADGKVYITLPDMSGIAQDKAASDLLLADIYKTMVLSQNCPGTSLSGEEHSLLSDGFDLLAWELELSMDETIEKYEKPAFALLDSGDDACSEEPELKARTIATLLKAGGDLTPLPDQEKAYHEWRSLMDAIRP